MDKNKFPPYIPWATDKYVKRRSESELARQYLLTIVVPGMRKHLCFGCVFSTLYDKNNKQYKINNRVSTLDEVKAIVEEIKKVNEA